MDTADPIQYPTVNLGGQVVEVKFRVGDIIRLKKEHQIDITEKREMKGVEAFEHIVVMLQAGIAHKIQKSTDEIADLIDLADLSSVTDAITGAMGKAFPQAKKALEAKDSKPNGAEPIQ